MSTPVWALWALSLIPTVVWLGPKLSALTAKDLASVLLFFWDVHCYLILLLELDKEKSRTSLLLRELSEE